MPSTLQVSVFLQRLLIEGRCSIQLSYWDPAEELQLMKFIIPWKSKPSRGITPCKNGEFSAQSREALSIRGEV